MRRKGLSQVLALIVAAAVLMMTALTIIFMTQGGLGDLDQSTSEQSCIGTVDAQCATTNQEINTPGVCLENGEPIPGVEDRITGDTVDCANWG